MFLMKVLFCHRGVLCTLTFSYEGKGALRGTCSYKPPVVAHSPWQVSARKADRVKESKFLTEFVSPQHYS